MAPKRTTSRQCDSIDCIAVFNQHLKSPSYLAVSWLNSVVLLTCCNARKLILMFLANVRAYGHGLVSDKFIQRITLIMMLVLNL